MADDPERKSVWDEPRNVTRLVYVLVAVCAAMMLADLAYDKHGHFSWENLFGFHGFFGFAAFMFIVLAGGQLRKVLGRDEDYYDR